MVLSENAGTEIKITPIKPKIRPKTFEVVSDSERKMAARIDAIIGLLFPITAASPGFSFEPPRNIPANPKNAAMPIIRSKNQCSLTLETGSPRKRASANNPIAAISARRAPKKMGEVPLAKPSLIKGKQRAHKNVTKTIFKLSFKLKSFFTYDQS